VNRLLSKLLRLSLFSKILIANSAIVALGVIVSVLVMRWQAQNPAAGAGYGAVLLFGVVALALSVSVNAIVLHTAFLPLQRLERVARRVCEGDTGARATLGLLSDPGTDQLAVTFNSMLDGLEAKAAEVQAYSRRLQELSDRVLVAQEEERLRISRELHDEIGQQLSVLLLSLRLFRDAVDGRQVTADVLHKQATELGELVRETLEGVRRLALDLHPRVLDDLGLTVALQTYVEEWSHRSGIPANFESHVAEEVPLSPSSEIAIYRMVQETLANAAKHADPTHVTVTLTPTAGALEVTVRDDGHGAGPNGLTAGLGLFSVQERISFAGGTFTVRSTPAGTTATATLPLAGDNGAAYHPLKTSLAPASGTHAVRA
jgi:two-component system, NarL family, sensor histidine kinase UhpB